MMNLMRADIYRIIRGKSLYITFAAIFALNLLSISAMLDVQVLRVGPMPALEQQAMRFNGANIAEVLYNRTYNLIFFLLPLLIAVAAPIFSNGTVKNDIAWGVSRTKLYFSKLLCGAALCALMLLFYVSSGMVVATVFHGFGDIASGFWVGLLQTLGMQLFMLLAMSCIGIFLMFTTKRTSAVVSAYITFAAAPIIIVAILMDVANINPVRLLDFDILLTIRRLGFMGQMEASEIRTALGVGTAYMFLTTAAGIMLFRKAEIK